MADRRRRRLSENDSGDELSQNTSATSVGERPSECESEGEHIEPEISEYESTAETSPDRRRCAAKEKEEDSETETESETGDDDSVTAEEDSGEDVVIEDSSVVSEERQSGDGEEQPNENLDIDEDSKNPAYIPRKGAFYEHDMRLDPNEEPPRPEPPRGKGKLWKDDTKWIHDRYNQEEQAPRSREELVAMYGYDIMQSDQPPPEPPTMDRQRRPPRKQRFEDFIPNDGEPRTDDRQGNKGRSYDNDFPPPRYNRDDEGQGFRGRGRGGFRGGGPRPRGTNTPDRAERNKSYVELQREEARFNRENQGDVEADSRGYRDSARDNDSARGTFRGNRGSYRDRNRGDNRDNRPDNRDNRPDNRDNGPDNRDNRPDNRFENRNVDNRNVNTEVYSRSDNRDGAARDDRFAEQNIQTEQDTRFSHRDVDRYNNQGNRMEQDGRFGKRDNRTGQDSRFSNRDSRDNRTERDRFSNRDNMDKRFDIHAANRGNRNFRDNRDNRENRPFNERGSNDRDNTRVSRENNQGNTNYQRQNSEDGSKNYRESDNARNSRDNESGARNFRDKTGPRNFPDNRNRDEFRETRRNVKQDLSDIKGPISRQAPEPIQNRNTEQREKTPTEAYRKPNPKSYYKLSAATDDEKLENLENDDDEAGTGPVNEAEEISVKVSTAGERKSYSRDRRTGQTRTQDVVANAVTRGIKDLRMEGDTEDSTRPPAGISSSTKHQSTLPPRLQQQQQQQQERKKQQQQIQQQKQQQQQQSAQLEKQDASQGRSNKRYSSQRQRNVADLPGYPDAATSPSVPQNMPAAPQPAFKQEFSPPKPSANMQAQMMRPPPNFPTPGMAITATSTGHMSPTTAPVHRVPPPTSQIPHPHIPPPRPLMSTQVPPPGTQVPPPGTQVPPPGTFGTSATTTIVPSVPLIPPPQLMTPAIIYATQPPPPAGFPITAGLPPMPLQFPSAPPSTALPPPPPPLSEAQLQMETIHGGTTYYPAETNHASRPKSSGTTFYNPNMQKKHVSPVRRTKLAIPIVNPEHVPKGRSGSDSEVLSDTPYSPLSATPPPTDDVSPLSTPDWKPTTLHTDHIGPLDSVASADGVTAFTTSVADNSVELGVSEKGDNLETCKSAEETSVVVKTEPESPTVLSSGDNKQAVIEVLLANEGTLVKSESVSETEKQTPSVTEIKTEL